MLKIWVVSLLFIATSATGQLRERLDSLMQITTQANQPGGALLVLIKNRIVCQHSYGLADVKTKSPITSTTNFRMASVSKQFTAMGILLLEKDGKLSLNDPLSRFFPDYNAQVGQKLKVRHLLTHSSGLIDYEAVMNPDQREQILDADVLALLKNRDSLYFEPGSQFRYSNSAYCLLALLIERVSGQSFATFIQERIFRPLHMNQSVVYEAGKTIPNRAMGYRKEGDAFIFSDQSVTSATKGDGGVYTSLADFQKWNAALRNSTLLDLKAALIRTGQPIPKMPGSFYGAGWFFRQPENPILFHSGSTCGFNNYVISIPSKQFLMAYFSNQADNKTSATNVVKLLVDAGYSELTDLLVLDDLTQ